jgi:type VI protein secretion system component Hcp
MPTLANTIQEKIIMKLIGSAFLLVAAAGLAAAQSTVSVQVDGIGVCAAQSWSFGASNPGAAATTAGGAGAAKGLLAPLTVNKAVDGCTTGLLKSTMGFPISRVTLTQTDAAGNRVMIVQLDNVFVVNDQIGGTTATPTPVESVSFSFQKITVTSYSTGGSHSFTWDLRTNMGS